MITERRAKIVNGVVQNIIVVDSDNIPDSATSWPLADGLQKGMIDDGAGNFIFPTELSLQASDFILVAYQFHTMIEEIGKDQTIRQAIAAIPDPHEKRIASNKLERGTTFLRNDPLVEALSAQLGMTKIEVDTLWLQAKDY